MPINPHCVTWVRPISGNMVEPTLDCRYPRLSEAA